MVERTARRLALLEDEIHKIGKHAKSVLSRTVYDEQEGESAALLYVPSVGIANWTAAEETFCEQNQVFNWGIMRE